MYLPIYKMYKQNATTKTKNIDNLYINTDINLPPIKLFTLYYYIGIAQRSQDQLLPLNTQ